MDKDRLITELRARTFEEDMREAEPLTVEALITKLAEYDPQLPVLVAWDWGHPDGLAWLAAHEVHDPEMGEFIAIDASFVDGPVPPPPAWPVDAPAAFIRWGVASELEKAARLATVPERAAVLTAAAREISALPADDPRLKYIAEYAPPTGDADSEPFLAVAADVVAGHGGDGAKTETTDEFLEALADAVHFLALASGDCPPGSVAPPPKTHP